MEQIYALSQEFGFRIIEDASHAVGGQYHANPIGSCQYSDICIFSFHPVKIITSAEGGMALTNSDKIAEKLKLFRSHGIVSDQNRMTEQSHGPWYYQQIALGFNYRMSDLQAALGLSQLERIDSFINKRNQLAKNYDHAFALTNLVTLTSKSDRLSSYHLYIVLLPEANIERHKQAIIKLREQGLCAHVHYIPVHLQPYYKEFGFNPGDFPNAEEYYQRAISLPLHPQLTSQEQEYIIEQVKALV